MIGYGARAGVHTGFRTITLVLYIGSLPKLGHMIPLWKGKNLIYFGVIRSNVKVTVTINRILTRGSFPHDNFSSVYWIFTKLDHMIALWKGKNPIHLGVIMLKVKVTVTINRIFDNRIVSAR